MLYEEIQSVLVRCSESGEIVEVDFSELSSQADHECEEYVAGSPSVSVYSGFQCESCLGFHLIRIYEAV